jgi:hypothetical protein
MINDKKIHLRTLSSSRNTLSINIPHKLAKLMGLSRNDVIRVELDETDEVLLIRKVYLEDL